MGRQRKGMRRGYTTGACAQAAARAAALSVSGAREFDADAAVQIILPNGETAQFNVAIHDHGTCSVVKDAGDDPDVTNGLQVFVTVVPRRDRRFPVAGGEGVGRVTRKGLAVKAGRPAINPVPLRLIRREVRAALPQGAAITVWIPGGEKVAHHTFNPRLGIAGGLSILGTTGRVEPWSAAAYQESLIPQLDVARASGARRAVLVPGAKGEKAALKAGMPAEAVVQTGNYAGMMLAAARERGFEQVALVGHAAKLMKLARGDMDTHSRRSAMPLDVLADCAIIAGTDPRAAAALKSASTTEAALHQLARANGLAAVDEAARRVAAAVSREFGLKADVYLTDGSGAIVGRSVEGMA